MTPASHRAAIAPRSFRATPSKLILGAFFGAPGASCQHFMPLQLPTVLFDCPGIDLGAILAQTTTIVDDCLQSPKAILLLDLWAYFGHAFVLEFVSFASCAPTAQNTEIL